MIAVHKEFVKNHKLELIDEITNEFGLLPHRMELLFNDWIVIIYNYLLIFVYYFFLRTQSCVM